MRAFVSSLFLIVLLSSPRVPAQDLIIRNANIVDPRNRTVTTGTLWIRDGKLVAEDREWFTAKKVDVLDAQGRWVIPGLVDMHVHSFGNQAPGGIFSGNTTPQVIADHVAKVGVTAFLDLFSHEDYIFGLRNQQRAGKTDGAEILAAGPCFTATNGHCSEYGVPTRIINTPDEARRQLAQLIPKSPDVVKVVYDHHDYGKDTRPTIDFATLQVLVQEATRAGLKTIVHVGTWQDVRDSVSARAAAVTHVPGGMVPDDIGPLMVANNVVHIPTIVVRVEAAEFYDRPEIMEAWAFRAAVSGEILHGYQNMARDKDQEERASRDRAARPTILESVGRLHEAGVKYLVGTDAGNVWALHGFSVHRELGYLVDAGLSTWEALAAATTAAGDFMRKEWGVQKGDVASLVILNKSPIENISHTQDIWRVVIRGRLFESPDAD